MVMRFRNKPETWSKLIQNPEDRPDAARVYIEQVGVPWTRFWYGFGEFDGYAIFEARLRLNRRASVHQLPAHEAFVVGGPSL
jgi:uncharacterized protein with GYD domain